jgi:hypothetical protein
MDGPESPESGRLDSSPCPIPIPTQDLVGPLETPLAQINISNIKEKLLGPTLGPSIPRKRGQPRGKIAQKKRADPVPSSQSQPALPASSFSMTVPSIGSQDIKDIIKEALGPLINEIQGLKAEIQQLKAQKTYSGQPAPTKEARPIIEVEDSQKGQNEAKKASKEIKGKKSLLTTKKATVGPSIATTATAIAPQKTFAEILRSSTPHEGQIAPWVTIQRKTKPLAQELAPKKAVEPSQRRIVFQRLKNAPQCASLPDMLLAINVAFKKMGLPEHIRLLKLIYTTTGSISGLLGEKALASMLVPSFSDALIKIARDYDTAIIGVNQAEQWYRLKVHGVLLSRYLSPEGLKLAKQEIETTQNLSLPFNPQWLGNRGAIKRRYEKNEIKFSTIVITVRNKLEADGLMAKGLHFGGYNHIVDRYWGLGPEEICPKCGEYGHTTFRGCTKPPRCYICAGPHEASEHQCPVQSCTAKMGKPCIHLPIKCIHCKGAHLATASYCPKRRSAIEAAKEAKRAALKLVESRRRIQVIIPRKKPEIVVPETPIATASKAPMTPTAPAKVHQTVEKEDADMEDSSQIEAQINLQLC